MLWKTVIASALCALTLSGCHDATALQCPTPQLQSSAGDLKESASDIQAYRDRFASGFSQNNIQEAAYGSMIVPSGPPMSCTGPGCLSLKEAMTQGRGEWWKCQS
jgi:hypothetical protein